MVEKRDGVYSCLFAVDKWNKIFTSASQDPSFVYSLIFTLGTAVVVCGSSKGVAWEVT